MTKSWACFGEEEDEGWSSQRIEQAEQLDSSHGGQPQQPSLPKRAKVKQEEQAGSEVQETGPKPTISIWKTVELHPCPARACPGPRVLIRTYGPVYSYNAHIRVENACRTTCSRYRVHWKACAMKMTESSWNVIPPTHGLVLWAFLLQPTSTCGDTFFPKFSYL